jgi:ABC-type dipeptide/oligopeptide/nickel transport system permease subunit
MRLRRDRVAMAGGIYTIFLVLVAIIGPHLVQNPDAFHANLIDPTFSRPYGPWGGISLAHPLGVDLPFGRDMLSRVVNLVGPILVYSTLLIPVNILFEAALSYLGVGIMPPTPSWGEMVTDAISNHFYSIDPMLMVIPGLAIFLAVMAFNLFGDGLRDALDPRSSR